MNHTKVKNIAHLDELIEQGKHDFAIVLNGGLLSRKTINKWGEGYHVFNSIDGTYQSILNLFNENETNIGVALKKGALFAEEM